MANCFTNDPKQRAALKKLMGSNIVRDWLTNPAAVKLGNTDSETLSWLWRKYTGKNFDPISERMTKADVRVFEQGLKEWLPTLGTRAGFMSNYFKLPKALLRNIKGGQDLINEIGQITSFHQRQVKEAGRQIETILQNYYKTFNDPNSPIVQEMKKVWSKEKYQKFQDLEKMMILADTPEKKRAVMKDLIKMVGSGIVDPKDPTKTLDPIGGKIGRRMQKLLEGSVVPATEHEKNIVSSWNVFRTEGMRNLLNGAIAANKTIDLINKNDPGRVHLKKAMKKINEQIESLLISESESKKKVTNQFKFENGMFIPQDKNAMKVYDPVTKTYTDYLMTSANGEKIVGIKKYFPKYVIELTEIMNEVVAYAKSTDKSLYKNKSPQDILHQIELELSPEKISNRLKQAGETSKYFSLDPAYYLTKYAHDVASFNMRSRMNLAYTKATVDLVNLIRSNNAGKTNANVGEYARHLIDIITEIKDTALMGGGHNNSALNEAVRMINALEYTAKLGFSAKSGFKNKLQSLLNYVWFGRRGYSISKEFYEGTSREYDASDKQPLNNREMRDRQLKRMGMLYGEKAEGANIAAATGGSIDVMLVPKGFELDANGMLKYASKESMLKRAANKTSEWAEKSSKMTLSPVALGVGIVGEKTGILKESGGIKFLSQQWAENSNRIETFDMAFAHAFETMKRSKTYHMNQLKKKLGREPSTKEFYDYIERMSGNTALEMVKMLHFDYDNWAKAKILQKGGTGAGQVIGQFQHFKFAFFDLQYNILRDAKRDVKGFKFTQEHPVTGETVMSENIRRAMTFGSIYTLIPVLFGFMGFDVGGISSAFGWGIGEDRERKADLSSRGAPLENPLIDELARFSQYVMNSPNGGKEEELAHYGAYYGKNPITANMGPFVSDILTMAELTDFLNLTGDRYEEHRNLNYDPTDSDWWYQVARIFNIQAARTFWHTVPAIASHLWEKAFRIETGLFQPKWMEKWSKRKRQELLDGTYNQIGFLPNVYVDKKYKPLSTKLKEQKLKSLRQSTKRDVLKENDRLKAIQSLRGF